MAKIIDKIVQQKFAPNDKNVLWDDGENLKINRKGKWENTGTSLQQEKLDSINFGYYTYASGNVVANWGPFTIKGHETITVDTNTTHEPKYCKLNEGKREVYRRLRREDHESEIILSCYPIIIRKSKKNTNITIENESDYTETIRLFDYLKQNISNDTHYVESSVFNDVSLKQDVTIRIGELPPDFDLLLGKPVSIYEDDSSQTHEGICIGVTTEWYDNYSTRMIAISLLNSLNVEIVKIYVDIENLVTTVSLENKQIAVI